MTISEKQHTISSVTGNPSDRVLVRRALLSVSDKHGLLDLAKTLHEFGVELMSTGGTAKAIRAAGYPVVDVSEYTGFPECLDGRVKTLHPLIHGGIMYVRGNKTHEMAVANHNMLPIDMVVLNLYAFDATVAKGSDFETCVENIDIGGPSMLRSSAKNHQYVTAVTSPSQYGPILEELKQLDGQTSHALRRRLAAAAFAHSARYDASISSWFAGQLESSSSSALPVPPPLALLAYEREYALKYGCNPHQLPAGLYRSLGGDLPFRVKNGTPGYINLLDALNAWQLVKELREALGLPAAASFKHCSPAGAAVAVPLVGDETEAYGIEEYGEITPLALAYIRARQADPLCSYGDFVAVSDIIDVATANVLKKEVSDGIIAPGYSKEALDILSSKKGGKFIILESNPEYKPPTCEFREVYGVPLMQRRSDCILTPEMMQDPNLICTKAKDIPEDKARDLCLASITLKYTQSNSVAYAINGQVIGVGAGQQSRVDCVKLAGRKLHTWWMRQHPKLIGLEFAPSVKRQERVNSRVRYIEDNEGSDEQKEWLTKLDGVCIASDAFFPFRDNIDVASRYGVKFVAQAGSSIQDSAVTEAADEYGMRMCMTGTRLFHH